MELKREISEEGKKKYAEWKVLRILHLDSQKTQLIFFRYEVLAVISTIASALSGFTLASTNKVKNIDLAILATALLLITALVSLFIYLYHGRKNIDFLHKRIEEIPSLEIGEQSKVKGPNLYAYWPEVLFSLLIVGLTFLILSTIRIYE